mmetsp:Transcript_71153/g.164518  ORF Transcript_71153/g.164518 Transcript_71153/m.164518 type:complete len:245 (+) Transcript_71153:199-933(+)
MDRRCAVLDCRRHRGGCCGPLFDPADLANVPAHAGGAHGEAPAQLTRADDPCEGHDDRYPCRVRHAPVALHDHLRVCRDVHPVALRNGGRGRLLRHCARGNQLLAFGGCLHRAGRVHSEVVGGGLDVLRFRAYLLALHLAHCHEHADCGALRSRVRGRASGEAGDLDEGVAFQTHRHDPAHWPQYSRHQEGGPSHDGRESRSSVGAARDRCGCCCARGPCRLHLPRPSGARLGRLHGGGAAVPR